jgi:hypothetical protein
MSGKEGWAENMDEQRERLSREGAEQRGRMSREEG